ncbi:MAG: IS4 family transposase, partial [Ferruginibacter sp.]|nr:IS4 family transposase [Ferruginibacter sp.]
LIQGLFSKATGTIQSIAESRAEQKGFYRFLNNSKVHEQVLIEEMSTRCSILSKGKTVLCIQDTTEVNLSAHSGRLKADSGLGTIDAVKKGIGFKLHPNFVVDAETLMPYGFAGIRIWHRTPETKVQKKHKERVPIAQKESNKWLDGNKNAQTYLQQADKVIVIQDREGDIYEQFAMSWDPNIFLLIRSRCNRGLVDGEKLWDKLAASKSQGIYNCIIEEDTHKKITAREAIFEVRIAKVILQCPDRKSWGVGKQSLPVYAISTTEITVGIKDPVEWKLLTTLPIENLSDAVQIIHWYQCRWMIEEVFRVLKKECYDIESSELERGWAIRKLSLMILDTIIKLFQMHIAYSLPEGEDLSAAFIFEKKEMQCLQAAGKKLNGKTDKQSNPHNAETIKEATWIIARIGGWKGYKSQRNFGMTTLLKGLKKFYEIFNGWNMALDVGTR